MKMMKQSEVEINSCNVENKTLAEKPNENVGDPIVIDNLVNVEEHVDKCNTYKKPSFESISTQTLLSLPNNKAFRRNQFTQTCLNDSDSYQKSTIFTATSDFDLYIKLKNCLNMVETLKKEYDSHCKFKLYESNNDFGYGQHVKLASHGQSTNTGYEMFTNTCQKISKKKWRSTANYYYPRDLNANDKFSKSGFIFLIKNNERSRSQRVLISFDTGIKKLKINHLKKKTMQRHISEILSRKLFMNNIRKERDLIDLESEPSLMSQVSSIKIDCNVCFVKENENKFAQNNNKIAPVPDIETKQETDKGTNENVNDLNNNDNESLKTEYLYLPNPLRWNKTSSNVIEMSEIAIKTDNVFKPQKVILTSDSETSDHLNSVPPEKYKKQDKIHNSMKTRKNEPIHEDKTKRQPKKSKAKKLTFHGMLRFLRLKSKF